MAIDGVRAPSFDRGVCQRRFLARSANDPLCWHGISDYRGGVVWVLGVVLVDVGLPSFRRRVVFIFVASILRPFGMAFVAGKRWHQYLDRAFLGCGRDRFDQPQTEQRLNVVRFRKTLQARLRLVSERV